MLLASEAEKNGKRCRSITSLSQLSTYSMRFDHVQTAISNQTRCAQILLNSVLKSVESKRGSTVPNDKLILDSRDTSQRTNGSVIQGTCKLSL
jgi:hypothetical protein